MMRLDANALSQCVTNLLSNAEKYSRDERWIRLKVRRVWGLWKSLSQIKELAFLPKI